MHFMWEKSHIKGLVHKKRTYISLDHWYDSYDFFILEGKGVSEYHRIRTSSWYASPPLSHYKSWLEISMEFGVQKNSYRVLISSHQLVSLHSSSSSHWGFGWDYLYVIHQQVKFLTEPSNEFNT